MKILRSRWDRGLTLDVESLCSHLIKCNDDNNMLHVRKYLTSYSHNTFDLIIWQ